MPNRHHDGFILEVRIDYYFSLSLNISNFDKESRYD